jgi:anti-sigma-K factor RskA/putative zinc finger protein
MTMNCDTVRELAPAFVLGSLTRDEELAVREHLATCAQPHPEVEAFGGIVQYFAETVELIEPPAPLKERVLAAVAAAPQPSRSAATPQRGGTKVETPSNGFAGVPVAAPPVMSPPPERRAAERVAASAPARASRRRRLMTWLLGIAAVLAIVGLAAWSFLLQSQLSSATAYDRALASVLDLAAKPGSQTAILRGDGGQPPHGIAAVGSDGSVVLAMRDLQPTAGSEVYEVWAMAPDGGPVPVGGFQVGNDRTGSLTARLPPAGGVALALTRETGPGAQNPTTAVIAQGVASAPP